MTAENYDFVARTAQPASLRARDSLPQHGGVILAILDELLYEARMDNAQPLIHLLRLGFEAEAARRKGFSEIFEVHRAELRPTKRDDGRYEVTMQAMMPPEAALRIRRLTERAAQIILTEVPPC